MKHEKDEDGGIMPHHHTICLMDGNIRPIVSMLDQHADSTLLTLTVITAKRMCRGSLEAGSNRGAFVLD
jgi:hypothetical protein